MNKLKSWKFYHPFFEYKQGLENFIKPWEGGTFFEYDWDLYPSVFEYKKEFLDFNLPWTGHTFFAYDLVRNMKPQNIVELGTFKGTSLYSFAQGFKDENIDSIFYAVDSWEGEEQTGEYGNEIYDFVRKITRKYYPEQNVRLMRMYFSEALKEFEDKSIDVLHIDGLHTYDAVKDDYDSWKNKVKDDGIILFHDVNVADFGVWKVFEEAQKENRNSVCFKFKHNYGLGVIFKDKTLVEELVNDNYLHLFIETYKYIAMASLKAEEHKELNKKIKVLEKEIGERDEYIEHIKSIKKNKSNILRKLFK